MTGRKKRFSSSMWLGPPVLFVLAACGPIVRPYYVRSAGAYVTPVASRTPTAAVPKDLPPAESGKPGALIRKIAEKYLGVPYRFAGQSKRGMDCSGFLRQVFSEAQGLDLPHSSAGIWKLGSPVDREDLIVGDVVFFKVMGFIDHSGIYMGNNYFIHSATSVGVSYSSLDAPYFVDHYAGARRLAD
jgi:cell wall-associated NlpC family hydrolase